MTFPVISDTPTETMSVELPHTQEVLVGLPAVVDPHHGNPSKGWFTGSNEFKAWVVQPSEAFAYHISAVLTYADRLRCGICRPE